MISYRVSVDEDLSQVYSFEANAQAAIQTALDKSAAAILNKLRQSFLAESSPDGKAWLPSGAGSKRRSRGGTGTLFDTGRLFRSIQLYSPSPDVREIGTDVPYGRKHQLGIDGMVKREFLGFTEAHSKLAQRIFLNEVKKLVKV